MILEKKSWQWALLLVLAFIWGTSFILMKKALVAFSDVQVASFRIFFTFIFYAPFVIKRLKKINKSNIVSLIIVGLIGNGIPAFLFTKAQTQIDSSMAGILNSLTPLFTLFVGLLFYKSHVKLVNILGLILGFLGAAGLIFQGIPGGSGFQASAYSIFIIVATLCYGISVNEIKYKLAGMDALSIASLSFFLIGPFAGINLLFTDLHTSFSNPAAMESLLYVILLSFFSSFIAVIFFNVLIKYTTAIFAASVTYIIPVFAVLWGLFDGEGIVATELMWIFVIIIGVYLVNKQKLINI